ncbi:hypothetical protein EON77_15105, partial [bacterium]
TWSPPTPTGSRYAGEVSYHLYDGVRGDQVACAPEPGSTLYEPARLGYMVTALSYTLFDTLGRGAVCGRCARVSANGRAVTVKIIDRMTHPTRLLDLSEQAFAELAPTEQGVVQVQFDIVDCP